MRKINLPRLRRRNRRMLAVIALAALALALAILRCHADTSVKVTLPDETIRIADQQWDNRNIAYPLVCYKDTVYLPAPAAKTLGLTVRRTADGGTAVTVNGVPEDYTPQKSDKENARRSSAAVLDGPITVAGVPYDNAAAEYPFLEYRGAVYIPMTEALCGTLCVEYDRDSGAGLSLRATGRLRGTSVDELPQFILHMGGVTADGQTDTNSVEAADYSYECGYRWLELDFNWTSDGALVCIHDWGNWAKHQMGLSIATPTTLEEFERLNDTNPKFHSFTPALLDEWLQTHPDAMIVTDVKEDNVAAMEWLAEHYPDLRDRLVVQIYSFEEYAPIHALGYRNILLTMYRVSWADHHDFEALADFIRDNGILAITMGASDNIRDVFDFLTGTGIPVYVYTVNEPIDQLIWITRGAAGIYTDYGDLRASVSSGS